MSTTGGQQELIFRATSGDSAALDQLLLDHYNRLSRYIARKLREPLERHVSVEDILHETFIHAIRDIKKCEARSARSFSAWLNSVAENRLRHTFKRLKQKKRGGQQRQVHGPADSWASSAADLVEMLSAGSHTPSRSAARREAVRAVPRSA